MRNAAPKKSKRDPKTGIEAVPMALGRNERTSKRVAKIAGKMMRMTEVARKNGCKFLFASTGATILISDVATLAASALTQARPTIEPKKGRRKS